MQHGICLYSQFIDACIALISSAEAGCIEHLAVISGFYLETSPSNFSALSALSPTYSLGKSLILKNLTVTCWVYWRGGGGSKLERLYIYSFYISLKLLRRGLSIFFLRLQYHKSLDWHL